MECRETKDNGMVRRTAGGLDIRRIREKFHEMFGLALTLPDDEVAKKFSLTDEGDLVMILR
jgi:hypothetical protein